MTSIAEDTETSVQEVSMCIKGAGIYQKIRRKIARLLGKKIGEVFNTHHPERKRRSSWCKAA